MLILSLLPLENKVLVLEGVLLLTNKESGEWSEEEVEELEEDKVAKGGKVEEEDEEDEEVLPKW
jgi:hypothetical protein